MIPNSTPPRFVNNQLAPVVQRADGAIPRINHYPMDKYYQNRLSYPVDGDLSNGQCYSSFKQLVQDASWVS